MTSPTDQIQLEIWAIFQAQLTKALEATYKDIDDRYPVAGNANATRVLGVMTRSVLHSLFAQQLGAIEALILAEDVVDPAEIKTRREQGIEAGLQTGAAKVPS